MKVALKALLLLAGIGLASVAGVVIYVVGTGVSARDRPGAIETFVARNVRNAAIAWRARTLSNPVERAPEAVADGRAHFADHCAVCHGNDGSGETEMGQGLWPKPPDMRLGETQRLSDGELFYVIEQGIRFTGMPGFATGTPEGEADSWRLVHFIRHLPDITDAELEEMESLNPRSPAEIRQQMLEEQFLRGGERDAAVPAPPHAHPGGPHD